MLEQIDGSGTAYYYHADQLGSVRALTNQSGAVAATYAYDAYGNQTTTTGNVYNPLRYAGEYLDSESGFYYLRARYYDPSTQQFLTRDPLLAATEQAYTYANGSPTNYTDPSGLFVDTLLDAAFITMDVADVACNGLNWENALYLGADLLGLAIPFATGLGLEARAAIHAEDVVHAVDTANKIQRSGRGPSEFFIRYGSREEAEEAARLGRLSPKPGHRGNKWISDRGADMKPKSLGKRKTHSHRMDIETGPGTRDWLKQIAEQKSNEPGRYGIPVDRLDEFNLRVRGITSTPR